MSTDLTTPAGTRRPRLRGEERQKLQQLLADGYAGGASIRALALQHDQSFGLTRTLLLQAGVQLRSRKRRPKGEW